MGAIMREHDWSGSSLGVPAAWPQPLRTAVRFMLNTGHSMYIWWGADGACLYNDAYRASIGPERHPGSLGRAARDVWTEIWDIIGPQIEQVMAGGPATWHENQLVPITRNGRREDVYWTYSYGPIDDPAAPNGVGGVLVVCTETTATVLAERERAAQADRQQRLFDQAPSFMAVLEGPEHRFTYANPAYMRIVGDRDLLDTPLPPRCLKRSSRAMSISWTRSFRPAWLSPPPAQKSSWRPHTLVRRMSDISTSSINRSPARTVMSPASSSRATT